MHTVPPPAISVHLDFADARPASPPRDIPLIHADPSIDAIADRLAWLHDGGDLADYPGFGWADADYRPSDDDLAALHGGDHDDQFDPNDLAYWTLANGEYHEAEATLDEVDPDTEAEWAGRTARRRAFAAAEEGGAW